MAGAGIVTESEERNSGGIRITTWNVNGIRNPFGYQPWRDNRTFSGMFDILESDIVIMQELKIQRKDLRDDMVLVDGWDCFFSLPKHKKGYSGVGIYTRQSVCTPIKAEEGVLGVLCPPGKSTRYCDLPEDQAIGGYPSLSQLVDIGIDPVQLDAEGRCVVLEFPAFVLFGVYIPANSNGLRDDFRYGFFKALDARIRNLTSAGKRVILTGDLNITGHERDSARAEEEIKKLAMTHEEHISGPNRRLFNQLVDEGEVIGQRDKGRETVVFSDLCREFHPTRERMYTHWEQKINARPGNYGSRIDYILVSVSMRGWFSDANIQEGLQGSDHCPVYAILRPIVTLDGSEVHIKDIMNPSKIFENGQRQIEITTKHLLPYSGKLLPEFTKRRSIRDMFQKRITDEPESTVIKKQKTIQKDAKSNTTNQKSLKSFFQPKTPVADKSTEIGNETRMVADKSKAVQVPDMTPTKSPGSTAVESAAEDDKFIDPFTTRTEWTKLFSKRDPPRCEGHSEPCQKLQTKVKGSNCGRWFWICSRPVGPSGVKKNGTQWRCRSFIWASDVGKGG